MNKEFWFHVNWKERTFKVKQLHYNTLDTAYEACKRMYPGANVFAIKEPEQKADNKKR